MVFSSTTPSGYCLSSDSWPLPSPFFIKVSAAGLQARPSSPGALTHVTIHLTEWSPCLRFSSLLASSVPAGYSRARALGLATTHITSTCRITDADILCTPLLLPQLPHSSHGAQPHLLGLLAHRSSLRGKALVWTPPLAQQSLWFSSFIALPPIHSIPLLFTLFPSSGKISPLMNPTIYIQAPCS